MVLPLIKWLLKCWLWSSDWESCDHLQIPHSTLGLWWRRRKLLQRYPPAIQPVVLENHARYDCHRIRVEEPTGLNKKPDAGISTKQHYSRIVMINYSYHNGGIFPTKIDKLVESVEWCFQSSPSPVIFPIGSEKLSTQKIRDFGWLHPSSKLLSYPCQRVYGVGLLGFHKGPQDNTKGCQGQRNQRFRLGFRLTGVFHAGNGWEWGLLGLLFTTLMGHSLIPYVKRTSRCV